MCFNFSGQREAITIETKDVSSGEVTAPTLPDAQICENDTLIQETLCSNLEKRGSVGSMNTEEETDGPIINPGEVDDNAELPAPVPMMVTDRRLDFTATYRTKPVDESELDSDQVSFP